MNAYQRHRLTFPSKFLSYVLRTAIIILLSATCATAQGIHHPDQIATIIFDGIDSDGPSQTGVVGVDEEHELIVEIGGLLNKPTSLSDPGAPDQIAMAPYYGDTYPDYYDNTDRAEVDAITAQYGGGIMLCEDARFHEVTERSMFFGQRPTLSFCYATHDSVRDYPGIRAGLIADLTSTRRVRVTLLTVRVTDMPEDSFMGEGEVTFGCRVFSPLAAERYGIADPVNRIDHLGRTIEPIELDENELSAITQVLFDDFILPG